MRLPEVTKSWTCPYFEAIFGIGMVTIWTGVVSTSVLGAVSAVVAALLVGYLSGTRKTNRATTGHSC